MAPNLKPNLKPRLAVGLYPVTLNMIRMEEMPHNGKRFINIIMTVKSGEQEGRVLKFRAYDPFVVTTLAAELGVTIPEDIKIEQIAALFNQHDSDYVCEVGTKQDQLGITYNIPLRIRPGNRSSRKSRKNREDAQNETI